MTAPAGGATRAMDLRERGSWTPAQRVKNDVLYAAIRGALAACALLPDGALRALGRGAGHLAHAIFPSARRAALDNVALALPALSPAERRRLVARAFAQLGEHLGEAIAALCAGRPLAPLAFAQRERAVLDDARAAGRGVLFASAHLGPWERVAATLVAHGVPLTTLAREPYDPRLTALYERLRAPSGVRAIYRGHAGAAARIVRVLRGGGVLGAPMDLRSRVPSIDVPFLGLAAPTPLGPARIALRTGAAVVVGTVGPTEDGGGAVTTTRIATADLRSGAEGERALTARINDELSRRILALPHAWVWMHERFPRAESTGT
jgi:Kdo2-lipid IVA lauroyltransferase/acyltransferase